MYCFYHPPKLAKALVTWETSGRHPRPGGICIYLYVYVSPVRCGVWGVWGGMINHTESCNILRYIYYISISHEFPWIPMISTFYLVISAKKSRKISMTSGAAQEVHFLRAFFLSDLRKHQKHLCKFTFIIFYPSPWFFVFLGENC